MNIKSIPATEFDPEKHKHPTAGETLFPNQLVTVDFDGKVYAHHLTAENAGTVTRNVWAGGEIEVANEKEPGEIWVVEL